MASPRFSEQFRHKKTYMSKLGEFDLTNAKPVAAGGEQKSQFQKAAAAIVHQSFYAGSDAGSSVVSAAKTEPIVFAKPIRLQKRSIDDCHSECQTHVLATPGSLVSGSEPATAHRSSDLALSPQPPGHCRKISMPLQETKPRLIVDFVPYSMEDYRKIRLRKWMPLGGIGPRSQEGEDWKRGHFVHRRRLEYAQEIREQRRAMSPRK